jgi:outer membrane protein
LFEKTPFSDQLNQNFSKSFGLSLSIPLFNGLSATSNIQRARINVKNVQLSDDLAHRQVYKSIQQAVNDASSARKKLQATQKSVEAMTEAYQYAQKRFDAGLTSSLEFLTATNNLTRAKVEVLQAKYDYIFKIKILDFYAGNPIVF